jgi:hypothetical protein
VRAAKELHFNKNMEALKKMQAGADKLATVVGVTLGPKVRFLLLLLSLMEEEGGARVRACTRRLQRGWRRLLASAATMRLCMYTRMRHRQRARFARRPAAARTQKRHNEKHHNTHSTRTHQQTNKPTYARTPENKQNKQTNN